MGAYDRWHIGGYRGVKASPILNKGERTPLKFLLHNVIIKKAMYSLIVQSYTLIKQSSIPIGQSNTLIGSASEQAV